MNPLQVIIKKGFVTALFSLPLLVFAQSANLPQGDKHRVLLDRLEIKLGTQTDLNLMTAKPITRRLAVRVGQYADSLQQAGGNLLSKTDQQHLRSLFLDNREWYKGDKSWMASKKPIGKVFYKTPANFIEVNEKDFFLVVNPVIQYQQSFESGNDENVFVNTRGGAFRGLIAGKIGFSGYLTDNQERGARFAMDRIDSFQAVPGAGFYKAFKKTAVDYFDGRGSIHFNATRYLDFQFGYDRNFIGNGYRSLFLSDQSANYLFLKVNTRIWKLNYQNIFMELTPEFVKGAADNLLDKKYAAIHHLSVNVTPWLNLGVFESVVFGRKNHFEFTYLNPIMFLRVAEQQNGSSDNALVGMDFKANLFKRAQVYGQLLLDEFLLRELRAGNGWWGNKFGLQLGGKYIDAFGLKNLDLQGEINLVRPFTYSHSDSVSNYTHYNQPLAHPLGANFQEFIGIARYQPHPKWTATARLAFWKQGLDSSGTTSNVGSNIFKLYTTRSMGDYGYTIGSGVAHKGLNAQLLLSYEWKQNLYLEGVALIRKLSRPAGANYPPDATVFTVGLRWNMFRREYDY